MIVDGGRHREARVGDVRARSGQIGGIPVDDRHIGTVAARSLPAVGHGNRAGIAGAKVGHVPEGQRSSRRVGGEERHPEPVRVRHTQAVGKAPVAHDRGSKVHPVGR